MIKANTNQMWRSQYVAKDQPYPETMSDKEKKRLIRVGLAYEDDTPTMNDNKDEIQDYLTEHDISFTTDMTKPELLEKVNAD